MSKLTRYLFGQPEGSLYILTKENLLLSLTFTLILSGFMLLIYRGCHNSLTYNKKFSGALFMMAILSTVLLALIQNNPLLSLGVLGSLSICRVRTNTKDPRDLGFVFWSLSIGISSAAGAFFAGISSGVVIGAFLLIFYRMEKQKNRLMIIVRGQKKQLALVQKVIQQTGHSRVQSKNISEDAFELVYALDLPHQEETGLLSKISEIDGIWDVNVLAPETKVA